MSEPRVTVTLGPGRVARKRLSRAPVIKGPLPSSAVMYSDLEVKRSRPSLQSRLGGEADGPVGIKARLSGGQFGSSSSQQVTGKRQRQDDAKWQHDLYNESSNGTRDLAPGDLRGRLSRARGGSSNTGRVQDLRVQLSGAAGATPAGSTAAPPAKQRRLVSVATGGVRAEPSAPRQAQGAARAPLGAGKGGQGGPGGGQGGHGSQAGQGPVLPKTVASFLTGLGLAKYIAAFQVEEVDMAALRHMREDDLKEMGIPMGPRKKILLALNPQKS